MLSQEELARYNRHLIMPEIGMNGQEKLKKIRVLVIGAGGLGCPVLQYLAAAGVGTLAVADDDAVDASNLQRQILFATEDVGKNKARVAVAKLRMLNPLIHLQAITTRIDSSNALEVLRDFDIVVDGTDNFATRYLLNDACVLLNKPLVSGAIYRFEAQVSVFNYKGGPTYRCLYPEAGNMPSCAEAGVLGVLPGVAGCLMANEVLKIVLEKGEVLSGKLLVMDLLTMHINTFEFAADPANRAITSLGQYDEYCAQDIREITKEELKELQEKGISCQLIDVREPQEYHDKNIGGENIPLEDLLAHPERIAKDRRVILHCASGSRSRRAISLLQPRGYNNLYNLKGGIGGF